MLSIAMGIVSTKILWYQSKDTLLELKYILQLREKIKYLEKLHPCFQVVIHNRIILFDELPVIFATQWLILPKMKCTI